VSTTLAAPFMKRSFRPLLVMLALLSAGCQRRTNIVLIPSDSTTVVARDSASIELRQAQELWEGGADLDHAAAATAKLLEHEFTGRTPEEWQARASYLLDSLGVGAEYAESNGMFAANFFSRSDPEGGSWPYLFWSTKDGVVSQPLDAKNLHLQTLVTVRANGAALADTARIVAATFNRRSPGGLQPLAMAWALPPRGRPRLVQTLGADSLGGYGTAELESAADTGAVLSARTYRTPKGFIECATCPHAYTMTHFRLTPQGFTRSDYELVPSPYATFAAFIAALGRGDHIAAEALVSEPTLVVTAQGLGWSATKGGGWRPAPGTDESPLDMRFFRGQNDAYIVHFRQQGEGWVITGWDPAARTLE